MFFIGFVSSSDAATFNVSTEAELTTAITNSVDGDNIDFFENITITSTVTITKTLTFNGNGYTITVPVTGIDDAGVFNTSPSNFRVFDFSTSGKTIIINNLTIKGGFFSSSGGAINIASGVTAHLNNSTVSNSRASSGGGIVNRGTLYLNSSKINRCGANYGGGFLNSGSTAKMFVENSELIDNRSTSSGGGGGACENNGSAYLYISNSIFSNNNSTELGGAINNYASYVYAVNTTFTGNVAFGSFKGGAIAQNASGKTMYLVNCLFAYNYEYDAGGAPATFIQDDVHAYSGTINLYYCTYTASSTQSGTVNSIIGNIVDPMAADGSDNDIFTGGLLSTINDQNGDPFGSAQVFRPLLVKIGDTKSPTFQTGSTVLGDGCVVGFDNGSGTPTIGYKNPSTSVWTDLVGTGASSYPLTEDVLGNTRTDPPAPGAVEHIVDNYSILKVNSATNGTIAGGSIYGDVYPNGTSVTITAIADNGYVLTDWSYVTGGSGTVSGNPLTLTLNQNTELTPNFSSTTNRTITYIGNGNSGGTSPAIQTYTSGATATVSTNSGSLTKTGFNFDGWNTSENGSGTDYAENADFTINSNMTLYAKWSSLGGILPVELTYFNGRQHNESVILSWQTTTELNNSHFEVQRSADGINWMNIDRVYGAGTSTQVQNYQSIDRDPIVGRSYYRLKQVDFDEKFEFSDVVAIDFDDEDLDGNIFVFPNPASSYIYISKNKIQLDELVIINVTGQVVNENTIVEKVGENQVRLKVDKLSKGLYYLKYKDSFQPVIIER